MKKVCAYCRVSTDKKDQENSLENQQNYFNREIQKNKDYQFVKIYADKGISGTKLKRPEFDKMLNDAGLQRVIDEETGEITDSYKIIGEPKFDLILVKNTSRFARNVSVDVILKKLASNNVFVYFLDLNKSTENSDDITYIQIFSTFDERDSRDRSKKVKFGMQEGARKKNIYTNGQIYGYKYHPHPENCLEIIPYEAEIVRRIYSLYSDGMGSCMISRKLANENLLTRNGKAFSSSTILSILKNEKYAGIANGMRFTRGDLFGNHRLQQKGKEDQIRFETDKIPAIIDIETYNKAQKIREQSTSHKINKGKYIGKTDYAQKIICGKCGANYLACGTKQTKKNGMKRYYCCARRYRPELDENNNLNPCNNPAISQEELDQKLTSIGYSFMLANRQKNAVNELKAIREKLLQRIDQDNVERVKQLRDEINKIKSIKNKLLDEFLENSFTKEQLNEKLSYYNKKEMELDNLVKELSKTNEEIYKDVEEIEQTMYDLTEKISNFKNELNSGEARNKYSRKELLRNIKCINVSENGNLSVEFKAFEEIKELKEKYRGLISKIEYS